MKMVVSLIATFVVACIGWALIGSGSVILGGLVLGACVTFGYWMSVLFAFGSIQGYIDYLEELDAWATILIR